MVDSVAVLSPSDRILYQNEAVSGAKIKFYNAGTSTPRTVYSDSALSSSLGSTVYTDSDGYPVTSSGGSTKTAIYIGSAAYKVIITDASDATLISIDNLKGALDTSGFATGTLANAMPVISKTANYSIVSDDGFKIINANPSGGAFTLTLLSAVTATDGWWVYVRNNSFTTANEVTLATVLSETIRSTYGAVTSLKLSSGAGGFVVSDGTGYSWLPTDVAGGNNYLSSTIASASTVDLGAAISPYVIVSGTSTITSLGSAPNRFRIVRFSGALTLTHNGTSLILPGGSNLVTSADDVFMFISDNSGNWRCVSVPPLAAATQVDLEAASSTTRAVVAGRQHYHPGHPKAVINYTTITATTINWSYGVSSLTDRADGETTINFSTAFSGANNYAPTFGVNGFCHWVMVDSAETVTTSALPVECCNSATTRVDRPQFASVVGDV